MNIKQDEKLIKKTYKKLKRLYYNTPFKYPSLRDVSNRFLYSVKEIGINDTRKQFYNNTIYYYKVNIAIKRSYFSNYL